MADETEKISGSILDGAISEKRRLAIIAVQCASEVTAGVGMQHPILNSDWATQLSNYHARLREEVYNYLLSK